MSQALLLNQLKQLENPDGIIAFSVELRDRLGKFAFVRGGITSGDAPRFRQCFWEQSRIGGGWVQQQGPPSGSVGFTGRESTLLWEAGRGEIAGRRGAGSTIAGQEAWHKTGLAIAYTRDLYVTPYLGDVFENVICVLVPRLIENLPAITAFAVSPEFQQSVRSVNQKLSVDVRYFEKAPFDLEHWQKVADERYPDGLPEPHSDDPTQWLFRGDIPSSIDPLHVAVARLLGYAWPDQLDDGLGHLIDTDGIVTLAPLVNQEGVGNRLRALLQAAYESPAPERPKGAPEVEEPRVWDETTLPRLLARAGSPGMSLEDWLRDRFCEGHTKLFHQRPFLWHLWDGRKDGFHAIVNYHKLDSRNLERLTHVYLGEWIERQKQAADSGDRTAEGRLLAAQELQKKLELIRIGEKPFDIFVRWKSLAEQPIGWEPDLNDGVRMNIRPFVEAGILRGKVNANWNKDRGKDPKPNVSGTVERHNDLHFTLGEKRAAREAVWA